MSERIKAGDWIGTRGDAGWRFWLKPIYNGIRAYARARYKDIPNAETDMTHCYIALGDGTVFEMTFPVGRIVSFEEAGLASKFAAGRVGVVRWTRCEIWRNVLKSEAMRWCGVRYDAGDLVDFALTGLAGAWNWLLVHGMFRIFGDRAQRYGVCSTVAARVLQKAADAPIFQGSPDGVDPCFVFNVADAGDTWCPENITRKLTPESFR